METITIDLIESKDGFSKSIIIKQGSEIIRTNVYQDTVNIKDILHSYVTIMNGLVFMEVKPYGFKNKLKAIYKIIF